MFQTLKYNPLRPSRKPRRRSPATAPFEQSLTVRLTSLPLPPPSSPLPLSYLSHLADLLSATLSSAAALLSNPSLLDLPSLSALLDSTSALLDACNAASSLADRLLRRRLFLLLALRLLPSNPAASRAALLHWEEQSRIPNLPLRRSPPDLIRKLQPTAKGRAVYAVEAVAGLFAGAALVALGGAEKSDLVGIRAAAAPEFPWAEAFNKLAEAVSDALPACGETAAAAAAARELAAAIVGGEGERLTCAVGVTERVTEELTAGLEGVCNAVNGVFSVALSTRNTALGCFRVAPPKCKNNEKSIRTRTDS